MRRAKAPGICSSLYAHGPFCPKAPPELQESPSFRPDPALVPPWNIRPTGLSTPAPARASANPCFSALRGKRPPRRAARGSGCGAIDKPLETASRQVPQHLRRWSLPSSSRWDWRNSGKVLGAGQGAPRTPAHLAACREL